jgi:hypothetical protein
VEEQVYRFSDKTGTRIRPFSESALINSHSYSRGLQKAICDFGADHSFGRVNEKLKEHYGIQVPDSAARSITEYHAAQMSGQDIYQKRQAEADVIIGESDGSMVPIVEIPAINAEETEKIDRRKKRTLCWKEARLTLAHAKGSTAHCFAGTLESVEMAGQQLVMCVDRAGAHDKTHVYCIGDGAQWIANQVDEKFGAQGHYLIDFYHLCEYLSAAATCCAPGYEKIWMERQKKAMKENRFTEVLLALRTHLEPAQVEEVNAPVRACYRYIKNRPHQLDYQYAIDNELPIGSGEIESAHRYILQKRLKIAGAWWKLDNAKHMIDLRICRANDKWADYWRKAA